MAQPKSRRFSFLSFSSLGGVGDSEPATHDTQIFPRLKASISAARRRWSVSGKRTGRDTRPPKANNKLARTNTLPALGSISVPVPLQAYSKSGRRQTAHGHGGHGDDARRCRSLDTDRRRVPVPTTLQLSSETHLPPPPNSPSTPLTNRSQDSAPSQNMVGFDAWIAEQRGLVARRRPAFDPQAVFTPPEISEGDGDKCDQGKAQELGNNPSNTGANRGHTRRHTHGGQLSFPRAHTSTDMNTHDIGVRRTRTQSPEQTEFVATSPVRSLEGTDGHGHAPSNVPDIDAPAKPSFSPPSPGRETQCEPQPELDNSRLDHAQENIGWEEQIALSAVEFWQRAALGEEHTGPHDENLVQSMTANAMAHASSSSSLGNEHTYPVAQCPDKHNKCHLHRSAAGVELHHHASDHAKFERERHRKPTNAQCWSRNRAVLDRERKEKTGRVTRSWKESFGLKPQWVEGKKFGQLYGKDASPPKALSADALVGGSSAGPTIPTDVKPAEVGGSTAVLPYYPDKACSSGLPFPGPGFKLRGPACPGSPRKPYNSEIQEAIANGELWQGKFATEIRPVLKEPLPLVSTPAKPSTSKHGRSSSLAGPRDRAIPMAFSNLQSHLSGKRRKRSSAPPDPITDPVEDSRPPTPPPKDAPSPARGNGKAKQQPGEYNVADPQGTIRKYLGMNAAELANAVDHAQQLIKTAGRAETEDGHLLDSGSVSSGRLPSIRDKLPVTLQEYHHVVLSTAVAGDNDLTLSLRGTHYLLPALYVRGIRVTTENTYWDVVRGAHIVDIIGDVRNLVALSKRIQDVETVRLILRGQKVPWSLHIRCRSLVMFSHVPWSVAKRKMDDDGLDFHDDRCLVQIGPVPNGVMRLVLHVVYDDRSPGMTVARLARIPSPASLQHIILIFQRERQRGLPGLPAAKFRLSASPLVQSLIDTLADAMEKTSVAFTIVGLEMIAGKPCAQTYRSLVRAVASQGIDPTVAGDRLCVLSHGEYAAQVGTEEYALETSV